MFCAATGRYDLITKEERGHGQIQDPFLQILDRLKTTSYLSKPISKT